MMNLNLRSERAEINNGAKLRPEKKNQGGIPGGGMIEEWGNPFPLDICPTFS